MKEIILAKLGELAIKDKSWFILSDDNEPQTIVVHDLILVIKEQQAEIERLRAELEVMRDRMSSGTGWAGVESQQQPEPPQESLTVDILRTLNKRPFLNSDELSDSLGVARKSIVLQLRKMHDHASKYALIAFSNFWDGYELTAAGRDYLATKAE